MCQPTAQLFNGIPTPPELTEQSGSVRYINTRRPRPMNLKAAMRTAQCLDSRMEPSLDLDDFLYSGPPTSSSTYSDLNYNTCASPHGYSATLAEQNLLTPVSSIASPPCQHRIIEVDVALQYDASEEAHHPSPDSDASNMFMHNYEIGVTSQSTTPISIHAPVTDSTFDASMAPYMPVSPTAEAPESGQFQLGPYGVSGPQGDRHYPFSTQAAISPTGLQVATNAYGQRPLPSMAPNQHGMMENQDHLQPCRNISPASYQGFHGMPQDLSPIAAKRERSSVKARVRKPKRKSDASARASGRSSVSGPSSGVLMSDCDGRSGKGQLAAASQGGRGAKPTLVFKDSAPPDLKRLLELRKEFNNDKGKGMWDDITKVYNSEYGKQYGEHDRARLQMKLTRGVNRYALLPESEELRIIEAFEYDEKHKYERICARLAENGGSEVWPWKPAQIEGHLVILGLEEKVVDEKNNLRRKRREAQRKRHAANAMPISHESVEGITVQWVGNTRPALPNGGAGSNGMMGGSPATMTPQQAHRFGGMDAGMRRPSVYDMAGAPPPQQQQQHQVVDKHFISNEDHDEVMKQLDIKYYANGGDAADMAEQQHGHLEHTNQFYDQSIKTEQF